MNIYINKKEIQAINYACNQIGSYISEDEEVNKQNEEMCDELIHLLRKINKRKKKI